MEILDIAVTLGLSASIGFWTFVFMHSQIIKQLTAKEEAVDILKIEIENLKKDSTDIEAL